MPSSRMSTQNAGDLILKNLLYVPAAVQYADNLRNVIHDPIEDDMRGCRERPDSGTQLVTRSAGKGVIFDRGDNCADFSGNFLRSIPAGNTLVIIPNLIKIEQCFRRP
jgi:hypothetical protein